MPAPAPEDEIIWPERYAPANCAVHVHNELAMPDADPEAVWAWLIRAPLWPQWYPNAANVRMQGGDLSAGAQFRWKTFGVTIASTVREFEPCRRIAWDAQALGLDVYHAWLIRPLERGCLVTTEETQHGFLARLSNTAMPNRMFRYHQMWLEKLRERASSGLLPAGASSSSR